MPKPTKDNPEFSREREFKVILEDIQSQFRTFGEGLDRLDQRVERLEEIVPRVEHIERDVAAIKFVIPTLATKKELKEAIEQAVKPLATKQELKEAVEPLATKKDLQEFEKRLNAVESAR